MLNRIFFLLFSTQNQIQSFDKKLMNKKKNERINEKKCKYHVLEPINDIILINFKFLYLTKKY